MISFSFDNKKASVFLLRVGLAWVFAYAAVSSFARPFNWVGFLPSWSRSILPGFISEFAALDIIALLELLLALWLLSGKKLALAALASSFFLAGILFTNLGLLDATFRDGGLLLASLALVLLSR